MAPSPASAQLPLLRERLPFPSLAQEPLADVLRLIRTPNVGPVTFFHLIRRFGSAARALERLPEMARRGGKALAPCTAEAAEKEITATRRFGARLIVYGAAEYPPFLAMIPDPPPVIAVLGGAQLWQERRCIGMVGARNASANGCALAQKLARELGAEGMTVISGLARGIDTFAHKGALPGGTVAVTACGIDVVYPPENEALCRSIAEKGAVLTEQPFGTAPFAGSFPGRNRIISGMSEGVVVVEASPKSGSLITARYALEQGREVFAVPGSPLDPRSAGGNALIKQGAHLVENAGDILAGLAAAPHARLEENAPGFAPERFPEPDESVLAAAHASVLEKLGPSPVAVDELLAQCSLAAGLLYTVLLELELAGRISRTAGNRICLKAPISCAET